MERIWPAGVGTMVVSVHNTFQTKDFRVFRATLFAGLGLTGIVPIIHGWLLNYNITEVHKALTLDVLMGIIYLVSLHSAQAVLCRDIPLRKMPELSFAQFSACCLCLRCAACKLCRLDGLHWSCMMRER